MDEINAEDDESFARYRCSCVLIKRYSGEEVSSSSGAIDRLGVSGFLI